MTDLNEEETRLQGAPVSEGIAIGVPFFLNSFQEEVFPEFPITHGEVDEEIARYRRALFSSREDLERLQEDLVNEGSTEAVTIIDTHIQMLEDPLMTTHMEEKIRHMQQNTESVFRSVIQDYEERFSQNKDSFFQQRLIDVLDLSKRILDHLCPRQKINLSEIPPNSIVFAKELIPSDTAAVQASRVSAFVTYKGGGNSHAALIARAKGIPFVASIDMQLLQNARGKYVIVDGITGDVIINPASNTLKKYQQLKKRLNIHYNQLLENESHLVAQTRDGHRMRVLANIGGLEDLELLHRYGAEGIGLFRSEYLFLESCSLFCSEEEQYLAYCQVIEKSQGFPVVMRVFDIGGDKYPDLFLGQDLEPNPMLGCRGIRFLMRYKEVFRTQLRAILRASSFGDIHILLPLISDIEELRESKSLIQETRADLNKSGIRVKEQIPIGCMIEVPSAVFICDALAQECDFLSIGTNDLVQYSLGVDRSNPFMSNFAFPTHPSVIRMIKMILSEGKRHGKPVSICGEIASNPLFIPLLIGLTMTELSCAPRYIPAIKRMIRKCSFIESRELVEKMLLLNTSSEISQLLKEEYYRLLPDE